MEGLLGVYRADVCRVCMLPIILYSLKTYDELDAIGLMELPYRNRLDGMLDYTLIHKQCWENEQVALKVAERLNGNV